MPLSSPTYSTTYGKTEQDANMATTVGFIDTTNIAVATANANIAAGTTAIAVNAAAISAVETDSTSLGSAITALANNLAGGGPWQGDFVTRTDLQPLVAILRQIVAAL